MKRVFFGYLGVFALGISFLTAYAPFEREPGLSNQRGVQEIGLSVPDTILEDRGWRDVNEATLGADLIAGAYWTPTVDFSGGTKYYFDPTATTKGTGTADSPFRALGVEVASDSTILHRDAGGDTTNLANGPVVGDGDICVLMPGNHGNILFDSFYFDDWLAVVGVPSGGALFDSLGLATVEKVYFDNVYANRRTRQQWAAPGTGATDVPIQAALDSVDRIIFNNCRFGVEDPAVIAATWSDSATFNLNAVHGIASAGTAPSSRLHVQNSEFYGVAGGVRVYYLGDVANIIGNTVQYATRTGLLVGSADSVTISQNTSLDLIRSDPAGHGNGIAVNHSNTSGTSSYGLIEKNFIATSTDVTRGFGYRDASNGVGIGISFTNPADAADVHDNWTVQNNIVVHQGWGGIQMYDATNTSIINNTLVAQSDSSSWLTNSNSWPQVKFSGALTASVVAANNICGTVYWDDGADAGEVTESNNLETQILSGSGNELDFGVFDFVSWSGATGAAVNIDPRTYDLHLDAYSPAIRAGSSTYAPATDYAGDTRPDKVYDDIGAYVYDDPDNSTGAVTLALNNRGADYVNINWSGADADVDYYAIYRDDAESGTPVLYDTNITDEFYADSNVAADTTYTYSVAAIDSSGNSALSNEVVATKDTSAPSAIADLTVDAYYDQIDLSWSAVAASDLDYYNLYRDSEGKDLGSPLIDENDLFDTIAGGTETYTDTNVSTAGDITYFYRVAAVDSSGNVATLSNVASATPEAPLVIAAVDSLYDETNELASVDFTASSARMLSFRHQIDGGAWSSATTLDTAVTAATHYVDTSAEADGAEVNIMAYYAGEDTASQTVSIERDGAADTTPPSTTDVFAGVVVDTTGADILLTLSNMTIDEEGQVEFQWSNNTGSNYYGDSSWSPVTASTTVGDTIHTTLTDPADLNDIYIRFRLRDDEGTPNVSEWVAHQEPFTRASAGGGPAWAGNTVVYARSGQTSAPAGDVDVETGFRHMAIDMGSNNESDTVFGYTTTLGTFPIQGHGHDSGPYPFDFDSSNIADYSATNCDVVPFVYWGEVDNLSTATLTSATLYIHDYSITTTDNLQVAGVTADLYYEFVTESSTDNNSNYQYSDVAGTTAWSSDLNTADLTDIGNISSTMNGTDVGDFLTYDITTQIQAIIDAEKPLITAFYIPDYAARALYPPSEVHSRSIFLVLEVAE